MFLEYYAALSITPHCAKPCKTKGFAGVLRFGKQMIGTKKGNFWTSYRQSLITLWITSIKGGERGRFFELGGRGGGFSVRNGRRFANNGGWSGGVAAGGAGCADVRRSARQGGGAEG